MKTILKTLDVIEKIAELKKAGIQELSAITGFPPATVHRIVSVLTARHYLRRDPDSRKYSLSFRISELTTKFQQQFHFVSRARPYLEDLMNRTRESANLAVKDGDEMVYIDSVPSDYSFLRLFTKVGARVPLYNTGVGKVWLSNMSTKELDEYLERTSFELRTPHTLTRKAALRDQLERIREKGFAVDDEEFEIGVRCIATLIYGHDAKPVCSISVSGAVARITDDRIQVLGRIVKRSAEEISSDLGFSSE